MSLSEMAVWKGAPMGEPCNSATLPGLQGPPDSQTPNRILFIPMLGRMVTDQVRYHFLSSVSLTFTVTSMPTNAPGEPEYVPQRGRTCSGDQATPTRIRLRFPMMLLVGSKSIQPAPGRYACIHACVAPPPARPESFGVKMYPLTNRAAIPNDLAPSIIKTAKSRQLP